MGLALAIAIGDGQLSIRAPDRKIRAVEIVLLSFFPFSTAWKIILFKDDRQKRQAFWTFEGKVMSGNAWWREVEPRWRGWVS